MFLAGRIYEEKESGIWIAEIEALCIITQGESKDDAFSMLGEVANELLEGFKCSLRWLDKDAGRLLCEPENIPAALGWIIKRNRNDSDLTLAELAQAIGQTYPNSVAQYEKADREATFSKLDALLAPMHKKIVISIIDDEVA